MPGGLPISLLDLFYQHFQDMLPRGVKATRPRVPPGSDLPPLEGLTRHLVAEIRKAPVYCE
jgi:hypothetical protein